MICNKPVSTPKFLHVKNLYILVTCIHFHNSRGGKTLYFVPLESWHWKLLVNNVSHKIQLKKESKTLIQEDLYKIRYGSEYAGYRFKDEVMTTIIFLVIIFFFKYKDNKIHANFWDKSNNILAFNFTF